MEHLITPAKQVRSQRSLDRIIAAAETTLRGGGCESFSIAAIAAGSGISVGGIYARVKGKEELLQLVKESAIGRVVSTVDKRLNRRFKLVDKVVDAYVDALVSSFSSDEMLHRALFAAGNANTTLSDRGKQAREGNVKAFLDALLRTEPSFAACQRDSLEFAGDFAPTIISSRLSRANDMIDWPAFSQHLKVAVKSYLGTIHNPE